jgi:hypothetical protein
MGSQRETSAQLARRTESFPLVIPAEAGIHGDVSKINDLESYSLSTMDSRPCGARFILSLAKGGNDGKGSCVEVPQIHPVLRRVAQLILQREPAAEGL